MSKNFPVVKTVFYMSRGSFQWSFFWKKCIFFKIFVLWTNFFNFWSKDFQQDCQNWNVRFHKKTWKENNLFKKLCVCYSFSEMSQKLLALWRKFFGSVVKTAFDVSLISLREFFFEKDQILFSILAHWANPFWHSVEDFRAVLLENTILFFNHFRILSEQFPLSWQKKVVGLPKLLSTCLQQQFENKIFLKKSVEFFHFFRKLSQKNFWIFRNFFQWGWQKCILRVHRNISSKKCILKNFIHVFFTFSEIDRKKFRPSDKIFYAGLWKLHFTSL